MIEANDNLIYMANRMRLKSPEEEAVDEWIKRIEEIYEKEGKHKFWE